MFDFLNEIPIDILRFASLINMIFGMIFLYSLKRYGLIRWFWIAVIYGLGFIFLKGVEIIIYFLVGMNIIAYLMWKEGRLT